MARRLCSNWKVAILQQQKYQSFNSIGCSRLNRHVALKHFAIWCAQRTRASFFSLPELKPKTAKNRQRDPLSIS